MRETRTEEIIRVCGSGFAFLGALAGVGGFIATRDPWALFTSVFAGILAVRYYHTRSK